MEDLYQLYVNDKLSMQKIAKLKNCTIKTVCRNLKKQKIERRTLQEAQNVGKIELTRDILKQYYIDDDLSISEISRLLNYSSSCIKRALVKFKFGIKKSDTTGKKNGMFGRSFYNVWLEKYGKEEADKRLYEFKEKASIRLKGENNPMFGKPAPQGSGNGWAGWYNGIHFRSLLELSFLINYKDRFNLVIENAEKSKNAIQYKFNNEIRNYFADWIVNDKYLVEIKPEKLLNTPKNKAKFEAALLFCKNKGLKFKVITPKKIKFNELRELIKNKNVKLSERYYKKFLKYEETNGEFFDGKRNRKRKFFKER